MDIKKMAGAFSAISSTMAENASYLIELDARFGDGDLGISMREGFASVCAFLAGSTETDLGRALLGCSTAFNQAAPSTLGTIISFCLMGMARSLKGKTEASVEEVAAALETGVNLIMEKAKSKPGDKTILDSVVPAVQACKANAANGATAAFSAAYAAAQEGLENTKNMVGKHGRIAYYGDKTLGQIDGGAAAGMLIFKALNDFCA